MRTRSVERARYGVFLDRATDFLESARDCLSRGHHQAAASNAVHAAIAAVDAVTVFHVGSGVSRKGTRMPSISSGCWVSLNRRSSLGRAS